MAQLMGYWIQELVTTLINEDCCLLLDVFDVKDMLLQKYDSYYTLYDCDQTLS